MRGAGFIVALVTGVVVPGVLLAGGGSAPPNPSQPDNKVVQNAPPALSIQKPDLTVENIQIIGTTPDPSGGTAVKISYTIRNKGPVASNLRPTAAGAKVWTVSPATQGFFSYSLDMREYPNEKFPPCQGRSVVGMTLGPFQTAPALPFTRVVPAGKRVEFRALVDCENWIDESDETNNSMTLIWPPLGLSAPLKK